MTWLRRALLLGGQSKSEWNTENLSTFKKWNLDLTELQGRRLCGGIQAVRPHFGSDLEDYMLLWAVLVNVCHGDGRDVADGDGNGSWSAGWASK